MRVFLARFARVSLIVLTFFACTKDKQTPSSPTGETPNGPDGSAPSTDGGGPPGQDATPPPPPTAFVDISNQTMSFGGKTRSYVLAVPKDYDAATKYPLVLSFHGNPGAAVAEAVGLPFDSVSKNAAVIVYPQADTDSWDLYTSTDSNADMDWIRALPTEIATKANIDPDKIFGFGYSGGGFFLSQFTCRFGDLFKAISINAGGGPDEPNMGYGRYDNGCYQCPGGPVATVITHGASDTEVEPGSGEFTKNCFATFNGCGDTLTATTPAPCQLVDGCPTDKPVEWCLVPGQSHAPWAEAMSVAWTFFNAVP